MKLENLGYSDDIEKYRTDNQLKDFEPGRVIAEHRERYIVATAEGETEAEITGNIRFTATSREDFPAVGDWVLLMVHNSEIAIIHKILPRTSVIKRKSVKHFGEVQVIAANVDVALIVQAAGHDFNINRAERYLAICYESGVKPVILLTKTDLISAEEKTMLVQNIQRRIKNVPVFALSNETMEGYEELKSEIEKGKTYCMLGSSGVGKSTLINNLSGEVVMQTGSVSESTQKGRHITSHRELTVLQDGGILIDNPGMREVGIADSAKGLEITFDMISELGKKCRFKDCTHVNETGCAVLEAVESGEIDSASYENYLKMEREKQHFEASVVERRKKDKRFGKMMKDYQKKDIKQKGR
jgi:ribosome biogenesis GTPase